METYPRDLAGYGRTPPHADWPGGARVAVQFVLNLEEGGERCVLHGDETSEQFLSELANPAAYRDRHLSMESVYEYGTRVGAWRILDEFARRGLPLTVFGVAMAMERNPQLVRACIDAGHEIASHGWRWISYQEVPEAVEREHIARAVAIHTQLTGAPPRGWYTGRDSPNTRRLVVEHGGFAYDSDHYGDELPFWTRVQTADGGSVAHLVVPYTLDANDMRFASAPGFATGQQFFEYLRDAFDVLYAEGEDKPRMLSIGMHGRLLGRPGRFAGLQRFLDHVARHERAWVCRRIDIAEHWRARHPAPVADEPAPPTRKTQPRATAAGGSRLDEANALPTDAFVARFGGVFEHSPWVAEAVAARRPFASLDALHAAMCHEVRQAGRQAQLDLLNAHPLLAAPAGTALTRDSASEQAGAGLADLEANQAGLFQAANQLYRAKFGFPFIVAVRGLGFAQIVKLLGERSGRDAGVEFAEALRQVERIAALRLEALLAPR